MAKQKNNFRRKKEIVSICIYEYYARHEHESLNKRYTFTVQK